MKQISTETILLEREKLALIRAREARERQKSQMLSLVGDRDLTNIDINTDEGFNIIEGMVDEKVADTLVAHLQNLLSPGSNPGSFCFGSPLKNL